MGRGGSWRNREEVWGGGGGGGGGGGERREKEKGKWSRCLGDR